MSAAAVTPAAGWHGAHYLRAHVSALLEQIDAEGGTWSTTRAHVFLRTVCDVPKTRTARGALRTLHLLGLLDEHTDNGTRTYTRKDNA